MNLRFLVGLALSAVCSAGAAESPEVRFRTERAGWVSINLYRPDGALARRLMEAQRFPAGAHEVAWDGRADDGAPVPPGAYSWRGIFHEGIGLQLRGWAANAGATPWPTPDGKGDWGGDAGVPSAVAADAEKVYLGWSLAERGKCILACDLEGRVQWSHRRAEGLSGCKALAVDDGLLYVLGGPAGTAAEGGSVYRLDVKDGQPVPWPNGQLDLKIALFWPADATTKPETADAMAVRHHRIYLSFTSSEFLTVLDAKTGAYLQTVVGAPPGQIDVAPTKSDLPDAPDKLVDADFAVIALRGGVLGKVLFAHDPLWVITSELSPVERDARINALTVIGDGAKFHRHTAFVGFDAPLHQVQGRPLLAMEDIAWSAGKPGGRALLGPWQADGLRAIRSVALDAAGKLWVAEGDAFPKRFSVWETSEHPGKLAREFFGPAESGAPGGAINPLDPDLLFAHGCEWRIDRTTGRAACLGVVTRDVIGQARYGVGENGRAYLVAEGQGQAGAVSIFERLGDGDYRPRARFFSEDPGGGETSVWADENGDGDVQADETRKIPAVRLRTERTAQDLALIAHSAREPATSWRLEVESWSACGAPRYDLSRRNSLPDSGAWLSADNQFFLTPSGAALGCRAVEDGRERWRLPVTGAGEEFVGTARLRAPVGNVWVLRAADGRVRLVNEDGFVVAQFGTADAASARWPKAAARGAEMSGALLGGGMSLAHAVDGGLYLQAGDSAYWSLEVTGLDRVQALSGEKVAIPAAK